MSKGADNWYDLPRAADMTKRLTILMMGVLLAATDARGQSAGDALREVLFKGDFGATGALSENSSSALYGLLLGETTTFPSDPRQAGSRGSSIPTCGCRSGAAEFRADVCGRPFTTGRGKLNIGAAFQHTRFESVGGQPLTELEIPSPTGPATRSTATRPRSQVEIDRTIVSATYGIHDRVDIGVIVPMGAPLYRGSASYYQLFNGVEATKRTDSSGSSFGVGDIVIRTKAALIATHRFDAAAALDIRLPTGDPDKLLGTGYTQAKLMFIGGSTMGSLTPHVNFGYTLGGSGMDVRPR